eukprot:2131702-Pyramimonas_sp.AAC.1
MNIWGAYKLDKSFAEAREELERSCGKVFPTRDYRERIGHALGARWSFTGGAAGMPARRRKELQGYPFLI